MPKYEKNIKKENISRNTEEVNINIGTVYTWLIRNNIQSFNIVDINRLSNNIILTKPIKLYEPHTFLNKIKSKAVGPSV